METSASFEARSAPWSYPAARRKRGSQRRRKAVVLLSKAQRKIKNQRWNFHHQLSFGLVSCFGLIAVEDLNVRGLSRSWLTRSVHDAGWGSFFAMLAYKAERAGREW